MPPRVGRPPILPGADRAGRAFDARTRGTPAYSHRSLSPNRRRACAPRTAGSSAATVAVFADRRAPARRSAAPCRLRTRSRSRPRIPAGFAEARVVEGEAVEAAAVTVTSVSPSRSASSPGPCGGRYGRDLRRGRVVELASRRDIPRSRIPVAPAAPHPVRVSARPRRRQDLAVALAPSRRGRHLRLADVVAGVLAGVHLGRAAARTRSAGIGGRGDEICESLSSLKSRR